MALFSRKEQTKPEGQTATKPKAPKSAAPQTVSKALPTDRDLHSVIIKPRVTEKAVGKSEQNVYTFIVRKDATKHDVRDAVKALFAVTPIKVNIVNKTPRQYLSRTKGRTITEKGMKKAYVYLKAEDRIDLG